MSMFVTADVWILISVEVWRSVLLFLPPLILAGVERNARQNKIAIRDLRSAPAESPTGSEI